MKWGRSLLLVGATLGAACTSDGAVPPAGDPGATGATALESSPSGRVPDVSTTLAAPTEPGPTSTTAGPDIETTDDAGSAGGTTGTANTQPSTTNLGAPASEAGVASQWGNQPFSIAAALSYLPIALPEPGQPVPDAVGLTRDDRLWVTVTHLLAASALNETPRPQDATDEDILEWLLDLVQPDATSPHGIDADALLSELPAAGGLGSSSVFASEFGFGLDEIDAVAEVLHSPAQFTVLSGPPALPGGDFVKVAPDRWTLGNGDDYERSVDEISDWRPYGQPIRAATRDGLLALTGSTPVIDEWAVDNLDRLADDPSFAAVAAALDSVNTVSVRILREDFSLPDALTPSVQQLLDDGQFPISEQFDIMAAGTAVIDSRPVSVVVYAFNDDQAALSMEPVIRDLWTNGSTIDGEPYDDMFTAIDTVTEGRTVLLTASPLPPATTLTPLSLIFTSENVARHW